MGDDFLSAPRLPREESPCSYLSPHLFGLNSGYAVTRVTLKKHRKCREIESEPRADTGVGV